MTCLCPWQKAEQENEQKKKQEMAAEEPPTTSPKKKDTTPQKVRLTSPSFPSSVPSFIMQAATKEDLHGSSTPSWDFILQSRYQDLIVVLSVM